MAEETVVCQDLENLTVSEWLVRSVSKKFRKKKEDSQIEEENNSKGVSLRCFTLYGRGGGCKVGTDTGQVYGDMTTRRKSSASEEGNQYKIHATDETWFNCFSYGLREMFWKKNNKKLLRIEDSVQNNRIHIFLPDDILEMCLVRLPLSTLMTARLVCKKWRYLTSTSRFLQMRQEGSYQNPWLFVFGAVRNDYCSGEIHAFDVSLNRWRRIDADILKGRFMFSVASFQDNVYIVGGCSSLTSFGRVDRSSKKTHKGVLVFSPINKSWCKIASMKYARSMPVLAISEISSDFSTFQSLPNQRETRLLRSHCDGISDIYEDPHMLSLRCQFRYFYDESRSSLPCRKPYKFIKQEDNRSNTKLSRRYVLIAVGGLGSWDEPLDSGETYDPVSNKWVEIQRLPVDFGIASSGVVCNGIFYVYSENDRLAAYDIERGYWIGIQTTPFPPRIQEYHPKLVSCNDRLFMLSVSWCEGDGQIGQRNKAVRKLWELDLMSLSWTEASIHPDAPLDWNATFVADRNLIFGVEMFKIFGQVLDFLTVCKVSETGMKWSHISRNQMAHELDASSCLTKSMAMLYL